MRYKIAKSVECFACFLAIPSIILLLPAALVAYSADIISPQLRAEKDDDIYQECE